MSKEKQIEEMYEIITSDCTNDCEKCEFDDEQYCHSRNVAHQLYEAGYRKQSEGEWILEKEPDGTPYCFHCSVCDGDFHHIGIRVATAYCPNCGAKMKGGEG